MKLKHDNVGDRNFILFLLIRLVFFWGCGHKWLIHQNLSACVSNEVSRVINSSVCVCYIKGQILTDYRALSGLYWMFDAYNELTTEELWCRLISFYKADGWKTWMTLVWMQFRQNHFNWFEWEERDLTKNLAPGLLRLRKSDLAELKFIGYFSKIKLDIWR